MAEELELVKISELPEASNVTATDVFPVVQNNVTKKVTAPIIRKYVTDSLGTAAFLSKSDFEPSGSVFEVDLKSQARADEQNKRIDRIEVAAYLLRNNKIFKAYRSKALMLADVANIPANSLVHVVNDPANNAETNDINGQYHYDGNDFLKLPDGFLDLINEKSDQVLESSKSYTDGRITSLQQTAATDASTKANAAKDDAIHTAAIDAQLKADDAETAAIAAAAADATTKAETAKSEAIAAAATDASAKMQSAENNDVKLLLALQQIAQIISDNRDELDVLIATNASVINSLQTSTALEDQNINTRLAYLLLSIQQIVQTISDSRDELDITDTALLAEDQLINTRVTRLLLAIQQLALTISDNRDELDVLIATNASVISALQASTTLEDQNINTRLAYLLLSIQQIVQTISDSRDELDVTDTALLAEDQSINTRVTRLNTALQIVVDSINQLLVDLDDPLAYFTEANKLDRLIRQQEFVTEFSKLDGFDPENSTEANSVLDSSLLFAFDKPAHIIVIDVTTAAALPSSKLKTVTTTNPDGSTTTIYLDNVISAEIQVNVDGEILHSFCSMQVQGASSAGYAKKNWNFGFTDKAGVYNSNGIAEFSGKDVLLKIGDVKPHQEWVFKSNWIDHTHIRNAMSYNLWQQVMLTRNVFPLRDIDNSYIGKTGLNAQDTSATGHPIIYPALLRVNGQFYGIGGLGLGKKRQNYNISKNVATEILIGVNQWADIKLLDYKTLDEVGDIRYFEVKAPSTVSKAATYIENFRLFANMSLADFTTNISTYLDKQNIIDFYIFCDFIKAIDLVDNDRFKNLQICSWTGTKFFFMPYDLDSVFGLHWAGTSIAYPPDTAWMPITSATFFGKIYLIYKADIEARYAQLRKLNVLTVNNIYQQSRALTSQYSSEIFSSELTRWNSAQPSLTHTSLEQILNWTAQRLTFLDTKFNYVA